MLSDNMSWNDSCDEGAAVDCFWSHLVRNALLQASESQAAAATQASTSPGLLPSQRSHDRAVWCKKASSPSETRRARRSLSGASPSPNLSPPAALAQPQAPPAVSAFPHMSPSQGRTAEPTPSQGSLTGISAQSQGCTAKTVLSQGPHLQAPQDYAPPHSLPSSLSPGRAAMLTPSPGSLASPQAAAPEAAGSQTASKTISEASASAHMTTGRGLSAVPKAMGRKLSTEAWGFHGEMISKVCLVGLESGRKLACSQVTDTPCNHQNRLCVTSMQLRTCIICMRA